MSRVGRKPRRQPSRLGEKLLQIRTELELSQEGMQKRLLSIDPTLNLAAAQISYFEQGKREPNLLVLLAYSKASGISINDLADDEADLPY